MLSPDAARPLAFRRGLGLDPERERLELLRASAPGPNWAMTWAHSCASGRSAASAVQLAIRSAISCGHSSGTLSCTLSVRQGDWDADLHVASAMCPACYGFASACCNHHVVGPRQLLHQPRHHSVNASTRPDSNHMSCMVCQTSAFPRLLPSSWGCSHLTLRRLPRHVGRSNVTISHKTTPNENMSAFFDTCPAASRHSG